MMPSLLSHRSHRVLQPRFSFFEWNERLPDRDDEIDKRLTQPSLLTRLSINVALTTSLTNTSQIQEQISKEYTVAQAGGRSAAILPSGQKGNISRKKYHAHCPNPSAVVGICFLSPHFLLSIRRGICTLHNHPALIKNGAHTDCSGDRHLCSDMAFYRFGTAPTLTMLWSRTPPRCQRRFRFSLFTQSLLQSNAWLAQ